MRQFNQEILQQLTQLRRILQIICL